MRVLRVFLVLLVVAAGLCAAWPFRRRDPAPAIPAAGEQLVDVTLRRPDVTLEVSSASEHSPASGLTEAETSFDVGQLANRGPRTDLETLAPPPVLPQDFGPGGDLAASRRQWQPTRMKLARNQPAMRRHRLTDGDSLERLAERYLGDAQRGGEIYEANRDLLTAPDLLPLGRIIRIPPLGAVDELSPAQR